MNDTARKFNYPSSLIKEYAHWLVLLRPQQATLGSLILCSKSDATEASQLDAETFTELATVTKDIEQVLRQQLQAEKINYLMLMMVDPHVHYHVIPRYSGPQPFQSLEFSDPGWPALPELAHTHAMSPDEQLSLKQKLQAAWPA